MSDQSSNSVPPELQVLLDLELTIPNLTSGVAQQKLEAALLNVPGIGTMNFVEDKIAIRYNPENITKTEIFERIQGAGFSIGAEDSAPPAPSFDSQ